METEFEGKYDVSELIGKGSFGEVKKCVCKATHEIFAVKEICFTGDDERKKAYQEAKVKWLCIYVHLLKLCHCLLMNFFDSSTVIFVSLPSSGNRPECLMFFKLRKLQFDRN